MKKRGLSSIVATVLIILLVIVAIGIVWAVLKPSITKSAQSANLDCIKIDLELEAMNCSAGQFRVTSKAGDVTKLRFVTESATDSKVQDKVVSIKQLASTVVTLTETETVMPRINMTQAKVTAILVSEDGTEKICEIPATASCS
ncbi:MAG: hypothetical protein NT076_02910 [Candidatus Pacearchaeota archaeon]|nr:hypothetical protein [Candidatus Pacearchaeota archaeon]